MEALKEIGFNPVNFLLYFINFGLILILLTKFLYKPVLKMLDVRAAKEEEAEENFKKAEESLKQSRESYENMISAAKQESKEMVESQKSKLESIEKRAELEAREEKERLIAEAKEEAKKEAEKLVKGVSKDLVNEFVKVITSNGQIASANTTVEELTKRSLEEAEKEVLSSLKS